MIRIGVSGIEVEKIMNNLMPPQADNSQVNEIGRHEIGRADIVLHWTGIGGRHHDNGEVGEFPFLEPAAGFDPGKRGP